MALEFVQHFLGVIADGLVHDGEDLGQTRFELLFLGIRQRQRVNVLLSHLHQRIHRPLREPINGGAVHKGRVHTDTIPETMGYDIS